MFTPLEQTISLSLKQTTAAAQGQAVQSTTSSKQCERNCIRFGTSGFLLGGLYNFNLSIIKFLHGEQLLSGGVGSLVLYRLSYGEQSTQSLATGAAGCSLSTSERNETLLNLASFPSPATPLVNYVEIASAL